MCMTAELSFSQRLMAESRHMGVEIKVAADRIDELEADNAKLRELVQYMHRIIAESCAVQYPYPPEPVSYLSQIEAEKRMSELGIEVRQ